MFTQKISAAPPCQFHGFILSNPCYKVSYTPLYQAKADLDSGGSFDVDRHLLRFDTTHMINRQWMVGLGLKFDYEHWDFSEVNALAGIDQVGFWAPFARIGRKLGKHFRIDLNGGPTFNGKIIIEDRNARHIGETDYDTAPFVGLTL